MNPMKSDTALNTIVLHRLHRISHYTVISPNLQQEMESLLAAKAGAYSPKHSARANTRENNLFFIYLLPLKFSFQRSLTSIGSSAFARCTNLTSINIPNSVTYIGSLAFAQGSVGNIKSGVERITQHRLTEIQSKRNTKPISCCKLGDMTV